MKASVQTYIIVAMMMKLEIDYRERGETARKSSRRERAELYYTNKGIEVESKSLALGDFVFDDKVCYEYKTIDDFMQSFNKNHIFNQVTNQSAYYPFSYLIIEGSISRYIDSKRHYLKKHYETQKEYSIRLTNKYKGGLRRCRSICNVITVNTEHQAFQEMFLQTQKCLNLKSYGAMKRDNLATESVVDVVLCSVKNISTKKADTIKETLDITNLIDLIGCSVQDFTSVKGISKKTATNLHNFIHEGELGEI